MAISAKRYTDELKIEAVRQIVEYGRAKARAAALLDALKVGETWDARDTERAFNFERHWAALMARAPLGVAWSSAGPGAAGVGHLANV